MRTRQPRTGRQGATLPNAPTCAEATVESGFWFEALIYAPAGLRSTEAPEPVELRIVDDARAAIRAIRLQLRTNHVLALTPRELARSLEWADEGGCIQALAALHRGEPCGFSVVTHNGKRAEWSVRPVRFLSLIPPSSCHRSQQEPSPQPELSP